MYVEECIDLSNDMEWNGFTLKIGMKKESWLSTAKYFDETGSFFIKYEHKF